jgi:hypothetical protein
MLDATTDTSKELVGTQLKLSQRPVSSRVRSWDALPAKGDQEAFHNLINAIA